MQWFYLLVAGLFEISWAVGLKFSHGFTQIFPAVFTVISMILSFYFLSQALKQLPLGTAYVETNLHSFNCIWNYRTKIAC